MNKKGTMWIALGVPVLVAAIGVGGAFVNEWWKSNKKPANLLMETLITYFPEAESEHMIGGFSIVELSSQDLEKASHYDGRESDIWSWPAEEENNCIARWNLFNESSTQSKMPAFFYY